MAFHGAFGAGRATLGLGPKRLKAAPGFDKSKWPDMANATWTSQVDDYYRTRGEEARTDDAAEPKGTGADGTRGDDRAPGSKPFAQRRISNLIGMDVVDLQHEEVADVEDLVVDTKRTTIGWVRGVQLRDAKGLRPGSQPAKCSRGATVFLGCAGPMVAAGFCPHQKSASRANWRRFGAGLQPSLVAALAALGEGVVEERGRSVDCGPLRARRTRRRAGGHSGARPLPLPWPAPLL